MNRIKVTGANNVLYFPEGTKLYGIPLAGPETWQEGFERRCFATQDFTIISPSPDFWTYNTNESAIPGSGAITIELEEIPDPGPTAPPEGTEERYRRALEKIKDTACQISVYDIASEALDADY